MTTSETPYTIVVGIDFSETGDRALERAFDLSSKEANAEPHIVYVASSYGPMLRLELADDVKTVSIDEASDYLKAYVEKQLGKYRQSKSANFARAVTHIRVGAAADEVAQLAADLDAELVVIGTHGRRGVRRVLLGSVAEGVVRLSRCPVLVVRPKDHGELEQAVVPSIAPPCPACVEARKRSGGKELWCSSHREKHGRRHTYHYTDRNVEARENQPLALKE